MPSAAERPAASYDVPDSLLYTGVACAITWSAAVPAILAWQRHVAPAPPAVAAAGLSAFGPLLAALVVAGRRRALRGVFGHWRTSPVWVLAAFFTPMALHLVATALSRATGGPATPWFHPPQTAENVAALVVFPLGEEFGWRGFLQPRMERRFGVVRGSLVVGLAWGVWHLFYACMPPSGRFDAGEFALTVADVVLYSLPIAWAFARGRGSMAVAIAFHAGAHFDHLEREPLSNLRLHVIHLALAAVLAGLAAWSLSRRPPAPRDA